MTSKIHSLRLTLAFSLLFVAAGAAATNGYFTHGNGTKNKSMAGAGVAMPAGAIAISNNPAAALKVAGSFDVGASVFSPQRNYSSSTSLAMGNGGAFTIGPNSIDSDRNFFIIPHVAKTWALDDKSAWGVAFYGRGGMNTDWAGGTASFDPDGPGPAPVMTLPGTFGGGKAGVDLSQALLDIVYARRVNNQFVWGAGLVLAGQVFEAKGVGTFAGFTESFAASGGMTPPVSLSDNGHEFSFGAGAKIGAQIELSDNVSAAASFQTRINMSELDDYADLFAEQGGFDIPANAKFGVTWRPNSDLALSFDIEHTWFSDVDAVGNPIANLFGCPTAGAGGTDLASCLGGNNGGGFGWDDVTAFKIGVQWATSPEWTWRAGFSHAEQPVPDSEVLFNILAPAVIEDHISFGFTRRRGQNREINFALMYALESDVSGPNTFDPTQTIKLEMYQWEAEVSFGWGRH